MRDTHWRACRYLWWLIGRNLGGRVGPWRSGSARGTWTEGFGVGVEHKLLGIGVEFGVCDSGGYLLHFLMGLVDLRSRTHGHGWGVL